MSKKSLRKKCDWCGKTFRSTRSTARYCCKRHRQIFHEWCQCVNESRRIRDEEFDGDPDKAFKVDFEEGIEGLTLVAQNQKLAQMVNRAVFLMERYGARSDILMRKRDYNRKI